LLSGATPYPFTQVALAYLFSYLIGLTVKIAIKDKTSVLPVWICYAFGCAFVISQALSLYGFKQVSFFIGNMIKSSKTIAAVGVAF